MEISPERFVYQHNGVRICYQTFGSNTDDAIFLLAGGSQSMLSWSEDFIQLLNTPSHPHFVIRYDNRDTGRSTCYPKSTDETSKYPMNGKADYTINDLADDALAILDDIGIEKAHFVGFSLGGGIAYLIAGQKAPQRVKSISLLSTTPVGPSPRPEDNLPGIVPSLSEKLQACPIPKDWHNVEEVVKFFLYFHRCMSYITPSENEEAEVTNLSERVFERAEVNGTEVGTFFNQAGAAHVPWPRAALGGVVCPAVVIHGRYDQNVPLPHGEAVHKEIPGSRFVILEDTAHELPRRVWPVVVDCIFDVIDAGTMSESS